MNHRVFVPPPIYGQYVIFSYYCHTRASVLQGATVSFHARLLGCSVIEMATGRHATHAHIPRTHIRTHSYTHTDSYSHTFIHIHTTHTRIHTHTHSYTFIPHTHGFIHTHIHTHSYHTHTFSSPPPHPPKI